MTSEESILHRYAELLSECRRARLTGTRGAEDIYALQIEDCLSSLEFVPESGLVIDVGSGGGLPGVVWAVYRPETRFVLLDSINKKCEALREIVDALKLDNIDVVCSRSEDYAVEHREVFTLAGARALSSAGATAELLSPLVKKGGKVLTFKGEKVNEELEPVKGKWGILGLSEPLLKIYNSFRCVVTWDKLRKCPARFPRKAGQAGIKNFWEN